MSAPKPKPPAKKENVEKKDSKPSPKKPFERKPHLTHNPFRGNTELTELQRKLTKPKFKNH